MYSRPRPKRDPGPHPWQRRVDWRKLAIAITTGLVMAILFIKPLFPDKVSLAPGQAAPREIVAPVTVGYADERETARLRSLAEQSVEPIYARVADAAPQAERDLGAFFDTLARVRAHRQQVPLDEQVAELRAAAPRTLPDSALRILVRMSDERLAASRRIATRALADVMGGPLRSDTDDLRRATEQLPVRFLASGLPARDRDALAQAVAPFLRHNRLYDRPATEEARDREREAVQTVFRQVNRGEVVIRKGERVTPDHLEKFRRLGFQRPRADARKAICLTLLAFGMVGIFGLYLFQFQPRTFADVRSLLLISVIATSCLLLFRLGSGALDLNLSGEQSGYIGMMSTALAAMLVAALLNAQIALFVGICMSLVTALLDDNPLRFAVVALASALVGVTAVANLRDRAGILRAALAVAVANTIAILVMQGATAADFETDVAGAFTWGGLGGIGTVFLFLPAAALLERPFRLTTHLTLLELSDPTHPLLKRLSMEAPGTYAHSIIVGNLSESAAKAIGADSLFARVASYYHDIGKVVRPHFFVENQAAENRHTGMSASLSCLVVTAHVKDGVQLAEKHRLPPPIIDIIKEHHGTCLIKYFYHRAVTTGGEESAPALEHQFRYEGPRPQTKESGIIMLADAAEAAGRSLEKPSPGRIRDLVETIVRDRLADAQLDDCELTFKDLEKIIAAFTRLLSSLLHARVEYPAADTRELTRMVGDGTAAKELVETGEALADVPAPGGGAYQEASRT